MWLLLPGKIKLALCPFVNQWWETALYITPTGITTGRIPYQDEAFVIDFNFISHTASITTSNNKTKKLVLKPKTVADFYKEFMSALKSLGIKVSISTVPAEFPDLTPFNRDRKHKSYDKKYVERWFRLQLRLSIIFDEFRGRFNGKSSPVQFYWGGFDLNCTRFTGKSVSPPKVKGQLGRIMRYTENE